MFRKFFRCAAVAVLAINSSHAHELGAHLHGIAPLQAAADEHSLTLDFSSRLDDLVGFEHEPHHARQRSASADMATRLRPAEVVQPCRQD